MFNRKKLDRERMEAYLVYILLRARPLIAVCGLFLLVYSIAVLLQSLLIGCILVLVAAYVICLSTSFRIVVLTAHFAAWLATVGRSE